MDLEQPCFCEAILQVRINIQGCISQVFTEGLLTVNPTLKSIKRKNCGTSLQEHREICGKVHPRLSTLITSSKMELRDGVIYVCNLICF